MSPTARCTATPPAKPHDRHHRPTLNLLALTTTIEAARAGERIRVVANKVKDLGQEAAAGIDRSNAAVADLVAAGAELRDLVGQFTYTIAS